jgi:hypothetical protein
MEIVVPLLVLSGPFAAATYAVAIKKRWGNLELQDYLKTAFLVFTGPLGFVAAHRVRHGLEH